MKTIILDTNSSWLDFRAGQGDDTCTTLTDALKLIEAGGYDCVIVSALMLADVPALVNTGVRVEVVSNIITSGEAVSAYRAGAVDYWQRWIE